MPNSAFERPADGAFRLLVGRRSTRTLGRQQYQAETQRFEPMRTEILYHGTNGDHILSIVNSGAMRSSEGKIFFARHRWEDCLMHGADTRRKASFVIKVKATIPDGVLNYVTATAGVASTFVVETRQPLPTQVLEMYARRPTPSGFETTHLVGSGAIKSFLGA